MKLFGKTQVLTLMAACAISTSFGQSADQTLREQADAARRMAEDARQNTDLLRDAIREQVKERSRDWSRDIAGDFTRDALSQVQVQLELAQAMPKPAPAPAAAPMPPMPKFNGQTMRIDWAGSGSYESGKSQLNSRNYDKAVETFDKVINAKNPSPRVEGAYYWKAYALNKLGKRDEALAALNDLQTKFPQSGWVNDAKALQAEVRQSNGQPVAPEDQANEDLKIYAINALMSSDSDRAVPLLEGILNNPKMSPKLKERAIFVLAQSNSDKAHDIVGRYAKGASNPDLQLTAVEYLGTFRSKDSRQLLSEVYASSKDLTVRRAVLRSFGMSHDVEHLISAAKTEQNPELRDEAIRSLGRVHDDAAIAGLVGLYGSESVYGIKAEILQSLANGGAVKQLIECARKEKDPELKKVAVQRLGQMKSKEALDFIEELLK